MVLISAVMLALSLALTSSAQSSSGPDSTDTVAASSTDTAAASSTDTAVSSATDSASPSSTISSPATMSSMVSSSAGSSSTVLTFFQPASTQLPMAGVAGSLIDVQNGLTTAVITPLTFANSVTPTETVTFGPSTFVGVIQTPTSGGTVFVTDICTFTAQTTGTCTISASGPTGTQSTVGTVASTDIATVSITLTAGDLAALTGSSAMTTMTASSHNMAAATMAPKAVVAVGAVGLAALLL